MTGAIKKAQKVMRNVYITVRNGLLLPSHIAVSGESSDFVLARYSWPGFEFSFALFLICLLIVVLPVLPVETEWDDTCNRDPFITVCGAGGPWLELWISNWAMYSNCGGSWS